ILFWATNGLVTLPSLVPTSTLARWQSSSVGLNDPLVQVAVIVGLGLLALLLWWRWDRRRRRTEDAPATITLTPGRRPGGSAMSSRRCPWDCSASPHAARRGTEPTRRRPRPRSSTPSR